MMLMKREFLQDCIRTAKAGLGDDMEAGFLRYKTLIIKDANGRFNRFSASYISQNPHNWWMRVRNADVGRSQDNVLRNRSHTSYSHALVGGKAPPSVEDKVDVPNTTTEQVMPEPSPSEDGKNSDNITSVEVKETATDNSEEAVDDGNHR